MRRLVFALLVATGAGFWAFAQTVEPAPPSAAATTATETAAAEDPAATPPDPAADAADDAATAAAAVAADEAAKAAATGQAVDEAVEAAAEKAGLVVEPETIVPVGAEPVEMSAPLVPLPELVPPEAPKPTPVPVPPPPKPRVSRPKADPLASLAADATGLEIEAVLAQAPQTYLVFDVGASSLSVRARGVTLEQVPIQAAHVLSASAFLGGGRAAALSAPMVWKVAEAPEDVTRELIAPSELKPFVPEDERPEAEAASGSAAAKTTPDEEELRPPSNYRVRLSKGWEIAVLERPPRRGIVPRFLAAARSGWAEVLRRPIPHPPTFAVTVSAEDARRLHHLFRVDTHVLLTSSAPKAAATAQSAPAG